MSKYRDQKKSDEAPRTPAQILLGNKKILCERPEGMNFEDYKTLRKHQNKLIKLLRK